jgi:hypothetical protein
MMKQIYQWVGCLRSYIRISIFIDSPSSLPAGRACIPLTLLLYLIAGIWWLAEMQGVMAVVVQIGLEVGLLYALSFLILRFKNKPERLLQTMSALIGSSLVISLVSMSVLSFLPEAAAETPGNSLNLQVNLLLLFWNLAVISLIFKRAFEISTIAAGFVAFNFFLLFELILINILQ